MIHTRVCIFVFSSPQWTNPWRKKQITFATLTSIYCLQFPLAVFQITYLSCEDFCLELLSSSFIWLHLIVFFEETVKMIFYFFTVLRDHEGLFHIAFSHLLLHFHCSVHRSHFKSLLSSFLCMSSENPLNSFLDGGDQYPELHTVIRILLNHGFVV